MKFIAIQYFRGGPTLLAAFALASTLGWSACSDDSSSGGEADAAGTAEATVDGPEAFAAGRWEQQTQAGLLVLSLEESGDYSLADFENPGDADPKTQTLGTWSVEGTLLSLETTTSRLRTTFWADETVFSRRQVYTREGLGDGAEGSWQFEERADVLDANGNFTVSDVRTDKLVILGDGTATYTTRTVNASGSVVPGAPDIMDRPGEWALEGNDLTITYNTTGDIIRYTLVGDYLYDTSGSFLYFRAD